MKPLPLVICLSTALFFGGCCDPYCCDLLSRYNASSDLCVKLGVVRSLTGNLNLRWWDKPACDLNILRDFGSLTGHPPSIHSLGLSSGVTFLPDDESNDLKV